MTATSAGTWAPALAALAAGEDDEPLPFGEYADAWARLGHSMTTAAMKYQHAAADRDRMIAEALCKLVVDPETDHRGPSRAGGRRPHARSQMQGALHPATVQERMER